MKKNDFYTISKISTCFNVWDNSLVKTSETNSSLAKFKSVDAVVCSTEALVPVHSQVNDEVE